MRLVLFTIGIRGDVEPYISLGAALKASGHDVVIASHLEHQATVKDRGLQFKRLAGNPRLLFEGPQADSHLARSIRGEAVDPRPWLMRMAVMLEPSFERLLDDARKAAEGADGIVVTPFLLSLKAVAESLSVPWAVASPVPWARTRAFANPWTRHRRRLLYGLSYRIPWGLYFGQLLRATNRWRQRLGIASEVETDADSLASSACALVDGYTAALAPKPDDVPSSLVVTGAFWPEVPKSFAPDPELLSFLGAGEPPLYLRVGRTDDTVRRTFDAVLQSARRLGLRLLSTGPELENAPRSRDVFHAADIPHGWLFPFVSAVIHHGGAGTTAAALRAERPQLIVPVLGDHHFWGERVRAAGVGPAPIDVKQVHRARMDDVLTQLTGDERMRQRARQLGAVTQSEGGARLAARILSDGFLRYRGR